MKQMTLGACCLALLFAAVACQNDRERDRPRMSQQELQNRSQLEAYPEPVQAAFLRDYPRTTVTSVDVYNDASGRVVYEINYVRDGQASDVVYTAEGERVVAPSQRTPQPAPPAPAPPEPAPAPPARR